MTRTMTPRTTRPPCASTSSRLSRSRRSRRPRTDPDRRAIGPAPGKVTRATPYHRARCSSLMVGRSSRPPTSSVSSPALISRTSSARPSAASSSGRNGTTRSSTSSRSAASSTSRPTSRVWPAADGASAALMRIAPSTSHGRTSTGARRPRPGTPSCAARTSSSRPASSTGRGSASRTSSSGSRTRSAPLGWSYEVADTKLAHSVKASADPPDLRLQRAARGHPGRLPGAHARGPRRPGPRDEDVPDGGLPRLLPHGQGRLPGRGDRAPAPALYPPPPPSYPEPVEHCGICRWDVVCSARRRRDDHLSLVAGIASRTRTELVERGHPPPGAPSPSLTLPADTATAAHQPGGPAARPGAGPHPGAGRGRASRAARAARASR